MFARLKQVLPKYANLYEILINTTLQDVVYKIEFLLSLC